VSITDRGRPVVSCSEWHEDGTAGEHDGAPQGGRQPPAGVQEPAVLAAVAAARDADPGGGEWPVLALELGQPAQPAVAWVEVDH
jgi:hypothetical protein